MTRRAVAVLPTLNEAAHIGGLLDQLVRLPADQLVEILVADGGSTDATRAIVTEAAARDPRIRLIDNPARIQSAGVNRAVAAADPAADTVVRIDAHARYPADYVPRILATFAETGADMVAVRLDTQGETCLQRGIAAAQNSRAGTGGAAHRVGGVSGFVDHGHHAGIDRRLFAAIGGYDESFVANEDAEFDYRARRAGGRIWLAGDIAVTYFPRRTLGTLFTQYRRYGRGRAQNYLKHRERLRLRQLASPILVAGIGGSLLLAPVLPALLLVPLGYLLALGLAAFLLWTRAPSACTLAAAPAMATMHLAWGIGFLGALAGARRKGRPAAPRARRSGEDKE